MENRNDGEANTTWLAPRMFKYISHTHPTRNWWQRSVVDRYQMLPTGENDASMVHKAGML
jgi:hypothetical protein